MQAKEQLSCSKVLPLLWDVRGAAAGVDAAAAGGSSQAIQPHLQRLQQQALLGGRQQLPRQQPLLLKAVQQGRVCGVCLSWCHYNNTPEVLMHSAQRVGVWAQGDAAVALATDGAVVLVQHVV
jgi:hypothetical protein